MKPFNESSYLAQVKRLRQQAEQVMTRFPVKNYKLNFIHHGENATFKVTTPKKNYLLRLHRNGYHTKPALLEELKWLRHLSAKTDIPVQSPISSKSGQFVELQSSQLAPSRYCSLLEWQPGRIKFKKLTPQSFYAVGELTARLHQSSSHRKTKHRNYWTADGLLGKESTFGSLQALKKILSAKDYFILEKCRKKTYSKISRYQKKNPDRLSLIHADLHFGNLLWEQDTLRPIDFDDSGYGFHLYDLAVTLYSSLRMLKAHSDKRAKHATEALLNGYCNISHLSEEDLEHLPYFILTRKLTMVGWLYERCDNPRLLESFNKTIKDNIREFRKTLKQGPTPLLR